MLASCILITENMKRYLSIVFFLFFLCIFSLPRVVFGVSSKSTLTPTYAVMVDREIPDESTMDKKPEYILPYPGILPNHPLYIIKRFRDFILDRLIVDPVRKTEFTILQADKRLAMGILLIDKGEAVLAEEIISKGEKYLYKGIQLLIEEKKLGKEVPSYVLERLDASLQKHFEVLGELVKEASEETRVGLSGSLDLVRQLQGDAGILKTNK